MSVCLDVCLDCVLIVSVDWKYEVKSEVSEDVKELGWRNYGHNFLPAKVWNCLCQSVCVYLSVNVCLCVCATGMVREGGGRGTHNDIFMICLFVTTSININQLYHILYYTCHMIYII